MATPERKVKAEVVKRLKARGAYYFFPVTSGYGHAGVPDIVACYKGCFIGIECKAPGGKLTELQKVEIAKINKAGGVAYCSWDALEVDNVLDLIDLRERKNG